MGQMLWLAMLLGHGAAGAGIDLRNASVETLENGLTVILLEDRRFPVVSVQALYRVGARNETGGKTGLAHFLEHMAFRETKNFPAMDVVSRIYAVGGEWHAYTWTDQTTYFSTVPREHADLLLRIEADRMANLLLDEDDMEAERGSVLAEMHMYENLPTSMLIDAVNYTSFLAHPYRNNTIGWESDIENLTHADVVDFYEQHYHPANAVIAVVGDFERDMVRKRIVELFGELPKRVATPLPHTLEPAQDGMRRVTLRAQESQRQFMLAYRAPSANSPDYAAFLVLQELLGTGSGVNFQQNDWGTPVLDNALLSGAAEGMTTWFPPSAQDYVFIIGGFAPEGMTTARVEAEVEARVASLRAKPVDDATLMQAIDDVQLALTADVQTTEDAAHQLAFFDGLAALDVLLELPQRIKAVTAADVQSVARKYLRPEQRSIAWHLPGAHTAADAPGVHPRALPDAAPPRTKGMRANPVPIVKQLSGGLPVLIQPSDFTPLMHLKVVLPGTGYTAGTGNDPVLGHSALNYSGPAEDLETLVASAAAELATLEFRAANTSTLSRVPDVRMEQTFDALMLERGDVREPVSTPVLLSAAGDVDTDRLVAALEHHFGTLAPAQSASKARLMPTEKELTVHLGLPVAQVQLGYLVRVPGPREPLADAYRLLLYILSHDYEGRLGKKAISESGLAYYIDSRYRSDGRNAWVSLATGTDMEKFQSLSELFAAEIARLSSEPPGTREIQEARQHWLGRLQSAAQSNSELAGQLASEWLWYGELLSADALQRRLDKLDRSDIRRAAEGIANGIAIRIVE